MRSVSKARPTRRALLASLIVAGLLTTLNSFATEMTARTHTSKPFAGVKVNGGTVTHTKKDGRHVLTLSDDFQVPDTPHPHWQVVDSKGKVYLLQRLDIKGDKMNRTITVPAYVPDIVKVQFWCAWAETPLGEASFDQPVK